MKKLKFDELTLSAPIQKAISDMGFEEASPIQSESIPYIMKGMDIIGQAQTGTGKTAAFAIPTIEKLEIGNKNIQAIVLCPTRELVIQVTEEFRKLTKYMEKISVVPIYGGQEIDRQFKALKNRPQVIIGTPGRTMDHMRRGTIVLNDVKTVVLDEADEMLDMGFREDIEFILQDTPEDRQTIMFPATMSPEILKLTQLYQNNPKKIDVTFQKVNAPKIDQVYFEIQEKTKPEALARLLDYHDIRLALVFCNTKSGVDDLVEVLKSRGYFAEGLHGDLSQKQRDKVMNGFRNGSVEILVATDVAARGIDVNNVEAVFNYDLPRDDEDYIHRIGRTGRAGKSGKSFTFVVGKQVYGLKRIERTNGIKIIRRQIPSLEDLGETRIKSFKTKIKKIVEKGTVSSYIPMIEKLMGDDYTAMDIAASLLKLAMDDRNENFDSKLKFEDQPYREERKPRNTRNQPRYKRAPEKKSTGKRQSKPSSSFEKYSKPKKKKNR